ncbi:unnamed protein product [Vitrella brassicaformis CCMP3155]|uniref:Uncharacterized protein n=1 Tax=Vitrella brassicaformis (strain CCMP3155) TaxID=1169540 RepID=A0A0G4EX65_VITBC|nr:unnamed protein product [Vitrella brassicaformis CCMP3155]|eukprot:CEM03388.1 unnamed protein product [Vitrella brassicaformis CCMP3155]
MDMSRDELGQLFQHGDILRAIRDPDLPLAANHLYQRHRQENAPPVSSRIRCQSAVVWLPGWDTKYLSMSSFIAHLVRRNEVMHHLHTLLRRMPHAAVEGCTTSTSFCMTDGVLASRRCAERWQPALRRVGWHQPGLRSRKNT